MGEDFDWLLPANGNARKTLTIAVNLGNYLNLQYFSMTLSKKITTPSHDLEGLEELLSIGSQTEFVSRRNTDTTFTSLSNAVTEVILAIETGAIPDGLMEKLTHAMPVIDSGTAIIYDDNFDMRGEVTMQLRFVAALRRDMFTNDGKMVSGYDKEDIKYVLDASEKLRKTLEDAHVKYLGFERVQGIVKAFTETISKIEDENLRRELLSKLKGHLDITSQLK